MLNHRMQVGNTLVLQGALVVAFLLISNGFSAADEEKPRERSPYAVETSLFMVANLVLPHPPDFYQLIGSFTYRKDNVFFVNATTWKYDGPLGIPYGSDFDSPDHAYPGYVRAFGLGGGYQRFLWRKAFAALHATPFLQRFVDADGLDLQSGFQLFLQTQMGYQFEFWEEQIFLKPGLSFNFWPVNTNLPDTFQEKEKNWPSYFLFEPYLNAGYKF